MTIAVKRVSRYGTSNDTTDDDDDDDDLVQMAPYCVVTSVVNRTDGE